MLSVQKYGGGLRNKESAHDSKLMRLVCVLAFLCGVFIVTLTARHLPGIQNAAADALLHDMI